MVRVVRIEIFLGGDPHDVGLFAQALGECPGGEAVARPAEDTWLE